MEYYNSVWTLLFLLRLMWTMLFIGISVPTLFLLLLLAGEIFPMGISDHALLPGQVHLHLVRVRKLANHQTALPQPHLSQIIFASLLPVVLV